MFASPSMNIFAAIVALQHWLFCSIAELIDVYLIVRCLSAMFNGAGFFNYIRTIRRFTFKFVLNENRIL